MASRDKLVYFICRIHSNNIVANHVEAFITLNNCSAMSRPKTQSTTYVNACGMRRYLLPQSKSCSFAPKTPRGDNL